MKKLEISISQGMKKLENKYKSNKYKYKSRNEETRERISISRG